MMPLKLVVDIERRKHDTRRASHLPNPVQIEYDAMDKWQADWANYNKGRWTYRLIPSIGEWTKRRHGQVNFYLTQLSTGYGCYTAYLYKYGHDVVEACPECRNERERAEHVFFTCPRYVNQRNCLERTMGFQVTPDDIVNLMLISCDNWNAVCVYAKRVLKRLRLAERTRSAELESSTC